MRMSLMFAAVTLLTGINLFFMALLQIVGGDKLIIPFC